MKERIESETRRLQLLLQWPLTRLGSEDSESDRSRTNRWGNERVRIGTQVLQTLHMSQIVKNMIFGTSYCKVDKENEIVRQTKKACLLRIASTRRLMELLAMNGANFGKAHSKELIHYCSGEIVLVDKRTGVTALAYVCDEMKIDEARMKLSLREEAVKTFN